MRTKKGNIFNALVLTMICLFVVLPNYSHASDLSTTIEWENKVENDSFKVWNIEFNAPVDGSYANSDYFYVTDEWGNNLRATVAISETSRNVVQVNPRYIYSIGTTYTLHISNEIKSIDGKSLSSGVEMDFTIQFNGEINHTSNIFVDNEYGNIITSEGITVKGLLESLEVTGDSVNINVMNKDYEVVSDMTIPVDNTMYIRIKDDINNIFFNLYVEPELQILNKDVVAQATKSRINVLSEKTVRQVLDAISTSKTSDIEAIIYRDTGVDVLEDTIVDNTMSYTVRRDGRRFRFNINVLHDIEIYSKNPDVNIDNTRSIIFGFDNMTINDLTSVIDSASGSYLFRVVDDKKIEIVYTDMILSNSMKLRIEDNNRTIYYDIRVIPILENLNSNVLESVDLHEIMVYTGKTVAEVINAIGTSNLLDDIYIIDPDTDRILDPTELVDNTVRLIIDRDDYFYSYTIYILNDIEIYSLNNRIHIDNERLWIYGFDNMTINDLTSTLYSNSGKYNYSVVDKNKVEITETDKFLTDSMLLKIEGGSQETYYQINASPILQNLNSDVIESVELYEIMVYQGKTVAEILASIGTSNPTDEKFIYDHDTDSKIGNSEEVNSTMELIINRNNHWYGFSITIQHDLDIVSQDDLIYVNNEWSEISTTDDITVKKLLEALESSNIGFSFHVVDESKNIIMNELRLLDSTMMLKIDYSGVVYYYDMYITPLLTNNNPEVINSINNNRVTIYPSNTVREVLSSISTSNVNDEIYIGDKEDRNNIIRDSEIVDISMRLYVKRDGRTYSYSLKIINDLNLYSTDDDIYVNNNYFTIDTLDNVTIDRLLRSLDAGSGSYNFSVTDKNKYEINETTRTLDETMFLKIVVNGQTIFYEIFATPTLQNLNLEVLESVDLYNITVFQGKTVAEVIAAIGTTNSSDFKFIKYTNDSNVPISGSKVVDNSMELIIFRNNINYGYRIDVLNGIELISTDKEIRIYNEIMTIDAYDNKTIQELIDSLYLNQEGFSFSVVNEDRIIISDTYKHLDSTMLLKVENNNFVTYYELDIRYFINVLDTSVVESFTNDKLNVFLNKTVNEVISAVNTMVENDDISIRSNGEIANGNTIVDNSMYVNVRRGIGNCIYRINVLYDSYILEVINYGVIPYVNTRNMTIETFEGTDVNTFINSLESDKVINVVYNNKIDIVELSQLLTDDMLLELDFDEYKLYYEIKPFPILISKDDYIAFIDQYNKRITIKPGTTIEELLIAIDTNQDTDSVEIYDMIGKKITNNKIDIISGMELRIIRSNHDYRYNFTIDFNEPELVYYELEPYIEINNYGQTIKTKNNITVQLLIDSLKESNPQYSFTALDSDYVKIRNLNNYVENRMVVGAQIYGIEFYYRVETELDIKMVIDNVVISIDEYNIINVHDGITGNQLLDAIETSFSDDIRTIKNYDDIEILDYNAPLNDSLLLEINSRDVPYYYYISIQEEII